MRKGLLGFLIIITVLGCVAEGKNTEQNIKERLIGEKIIYYDIAGRPVNYTISAADVQSIEKVEIKNELLWKVKVGNGLMWEIYLDRDGQNIVKKEQLFMT